VKKVIERGSKIIYKVTSEVAKDDEVDSRGRFFVLGVRVRVHLFTVLVPQRHLEKKENENK